MADQVHPIWTEDELDAALAGLHDDHASGQGNLAGARTALYAALGTPEPIMPRARRHWPRWAAAAAVVATLVAGTLVAESLGGDSGHTASAAALTLRQAATVAIHEQDPVLKPGQYRYIRENAWWSMMFTPSEGQTFAYLADNVIETWVPQNQNGDWRLRRSIVGERQWIAGSEQAAKAAGLTLSAGWPTGVITAPCGDFYPTDNVKPSCADIAKAAGWQEPTPAWLATLPTDPQAMMARLRQDSPAFKPGNGRGDAELLTYVADALRSGLIPAHVRGVLYQTLAMLPDLKITEQVANLDGKTGVAMGIDDTENKTRQEIIVDPATGQFIGERETNLVAQGGLKAGQVTESTSVTTTVVNSMGATS
jgi:hypothetical protein